MNLAMRILLIAVLSTVAQVFLPWWSAAIIAFAVELLLGRHDRLAFFSGFYGICIPWLLLSAYIDIKSGSVLSIRILEMFHLPGYGLILVVLTGLLGGLVGGMASLSGSWVGALRTQKELRHG